MDRTNNGSCNERGSATAEYVGVALAIGLLLANLAAPLGSNGTSLGAAAARALHGAVLVEAPDARPSGQPRRRLQFGAAGSQQQSTGSNPPQLGSAQLAGPQAQLMPGLTDWAFKHDSRTSSAGTAQWCILCAGVSASARPVVGTTVEGSAASFTHDRTDANQASGPGIRIDVAGRTALLAGEVSSAFSRTTGWGAVSGSLSGDAIIGARATAFAEARFDKNTQSLDAGVDALAGGAVRAQEHSSVSLLGITLSQTGGVEGWAGAGGRARGEFTREGGKITLGGALGFATGLGGAADLQLTVDATDLLTNPSKSLAPVLHLLGQQSVASGTSRKEQ